MYVTLNVHFIECTSRKLYVTLKSRHIECTSNWIHVHDFRGNCDFQRRQDWTPVGTDPSNVELFYVKLSRVEPSRVEWRIHVTENTRQIECVCHSGRHVALDVRHLECTSP